IGVADKPETTECWVIWVKRGMGTKLLWKRFRFHHTSLFPHPVAFFLDAIVRWICSSFYATGVRWNQFCLNVPIKLVKVQVREEWAEHRSLRRAAVRPVIGPFLQVSCPQQL